MTMLIKCHICNKRVEQFSLVTSERYRESGVRVERYCLCDEHMEELRSWFEATENDYELMQKMGGVCGTD